MSICGYPHNILIGNLTLVFNFAIVILLGVYHYFFGRYDMGIKVDTRVRGSSICYASQHGYGIGTVINVSGLTSHQYQVRWDNGYVDWYRESDFDVIKDKETKMSTPTTLIQKFNLAFKSEPEKSFIKAGVMNSDETLTTDGKDVLLMFLLSKNKEAFNTEVVQPILKEKEESK